MQQGYGRRHTLFVTLHHMPGKRVFRCAPTKHVSEDRHRQHIWRVLRALECLEATEHFKGTGNITGQGSAQAHLGK